MGSNNNKKQQPSNADPKGRVQNEIQYQKNRYEQQQGPMANAMAYNYGRGTESDYGNYTDMMNMYRGIASGQGGTAGSVDGGGGGYSPALVNAGQAGYSDPFKSYGGYEEFSRTGGYSDQDINNMRARGISPIRAAYANAERNINQQRTLQGGYSPNAIAAQVKMAREQGQSMADAGQNVEANLAQMRQQGRLAGLGGMSNIEGQRLGADVDISKFNTGLDFEGQKYNAGAMNSAAAQGAASRSAAAGQSAENQMAALRGMTQLYGTTPGMSNMFGNQLITAVGQGGTFGGNMINAGVNAENLPGAYDQTMGRVGDAMDLFGAASTAIYPWLNNRRGQTQGQQTQGQTTPGYQIPVRSNPGYGFGR